MLPWLLSPWQDLLKRQSSGIPHALLMTGLKGVGKHQFSRHLAQWLLCSKARKEGLEQPCNECHSCKLWQAGSHPDYRLCEPEEGSRQIRVDGIRQINDFLAQTPQIGRCQVVCIRPVEVMNINAANALLKTLEEPAGESYLLLETERFGSLMPTIRSRCQRITLVPPAQEQSLAWLAEQGFNDTALAQQALQMHQGAPLAAQQWLANDDNQQNQWLTQLAQWSRGELLLTDLSNAWSKLELTTLIHWFYTVLLDCLKETMGVESRLLALQGQTQQLHQNATLNPIKLLTLQTKVQQTLGQLLSGVGNYNKQLLIESLLIDWKNTLQRENNGR